MPGVALDRREEPGRPVCGGRAVRQSLSPSAEGASLPPRAAQGRGVGGSAEPGGQGRGPVRASGSAPEVAREGWVSRGVRRRYHRPDRPRRVNRFRQSGGLSQSCRWFVRGVPSPIFAPLRLGHADRRPTRDNRVFRNLHRPRDYPALTKNPRPRQLSPPTP